jgi:hypothetical protein
MSQSTKEKTEWLQSGIALGEESEKERIIDLLQDHVCPPCEERFEQFGLEPVLHTPFPHTSCEGLLGAITLIFEGGIK